MRSARRPFFAPEILQGSTMDCGPATLASLLQGFGISADFARLREHCQTDVDGTSINAIEDTANALGLSVQQVVVPADHVAIGVGLLPNLAVVVRPGNITHFVIAWRRVGPWIQIMDPAVGRKWLHARHFVRELYLHSATVPAAAWREYAGTEDFSAPLAARIQELGIPSRTAQRWIMTAQADSDWQPIAFLDAAARMLAAADCRRSTKARLLSHLVAARSHGDVPAEFWSVRPSADDQQSLVYRGAVLLKTIDSATRSPVPPHLRLRQAVIRPMGGALAFLTSLYRPKLATVSLCALALGITAVAAASEMAVIRTLADARGLSLRAAFFCALLALFLIQGLLENWSRRSLATEGRRLEISMHTALRAKLTRLGDRYFHSRLHSDLAERVHTIHYLRQLPELLAEALRCLLEVAALTVALILLLPHAAWYIAALSLFGVSVAVLSIRFVSDYEHRLRTITTALARYVHDALRGGVALRAHAGARQLHALYDGVAADWETAAVQRSVASLVAETTQRLGATVIVLLILVSTSRAGGVLLAIYWSMRVSSRTSELGPLVRRYQTVLSVIRRLKEVMEAPDDHEVITIAPSSAATTLHGVDIELRDAQVMGGGRAILNSLSLRLSAGEHVAIVGASGSGKSSLVGILLGLHQLSEGQLFVDGAPLDAQSLALLRRHTAWVDPQTQLWDRTLQENVAYGVDEFAVPMGTLLSEADILSFASQSPDGLSRRTGEGGSSLSGGEGQRVRLARAMARSARLAVLDEAFRGLEYSERASFTTRARKHWKHATLLYVTHDISIAATFPRVLVLVDGRIVADGGPQELLERSTPFRAMCEAEEVSRRDIWNAASWTRWHLQEGTISVSSTSA